MATLTSTAVPYAQEEDGSLLRAVVSRTTKDVKDSTTMCEDQCELVDALGIALNDPENKSVLDIHAMRERRLEAVLVREMNAIASHTNFCVAEKSVLHTQPAAALAPPSGDATTTTTTMPSKSNGISDKKIMKRKLPEPRYGWKNHSAKTHHWYL